MCICIFQDNTVVADPPRCELYKLCRPKPSAFRKFYERGLFPISLEKEGAGWKINWKVDILNLDFHYYLPLFFDGLTEEEQPYKFVVEQGISDMLDHGGPKTLPVLPQLIIPIKSKILFLHIMHISIKFIPQTVNSIAFS